MAANDRQTGSYYSKMTQTHYQFHLEDTELLLMIRDEAKNVNPCGFVAGNK